MNTKNFTQEDIENFNRDGYIIKRGFFTEEETNKVYNTALSDKVLSDNAYDLDDKDGFKTKLTLWYNPGDDIYGLLTRSQRMVNAVAILLGGTPAHFHSKLMQKEPKVGGAWEWHQDYGYWYNDGFLYPQLISVMVALTKANKENGCLQVLKGSHKIQRVEHGKAGGQVGIDPAIMEKAHQDFELVHVELNAGDTLFFHCNLMHRSDANLSDNSRWSLISAYNLVANVPYLKNPDSCITPIQMVSDDAILNSKESKLDASGAGFISQEDRDPLYSSK